MKKKIGTQLIKKEKNMWGTFSIYQLMTASLFDIFKIKPINRFQNFQLQIWQKENEIQFVKNYFRPEISNPDSHQGMKL